VGYGVAILFASGPVAETTTITTRKHEGDLLPRVARQSVEAALRGNAESAPVATGDFLNAARSVFVSLHQRNGKLRGCVGSVMPVCANVVEETWRNARLAALHDARFPSVTLRELPTLRFEVSVLHPPEEVSSDAQLDPQRYGVIVAAADGRRGVVLPAIESIDTVEKQLQLARRKGGIAPEELVDISRFEVDGFIED
jgi:AmmeMemoRadiSam system protein A